VPRLDDLEGAQDFFSTQAVGNEFPASWKRKKAPIWEQVALPDDIIDSIREFVARINHRKTVYEKWGFDAKMTTSRGLTALFYGPPGTGKSMVAGLIARELGLDLYKLDPARIV
jgi:SpoVK/Ycf46/Vps4 family AAA+-type ATPase